MKPWPLLAAGIAAVVLAAGAGYWFGRQGGHAGGSQKAAADQTSGPVVPVETVRLARKSISRSITVYGRVVAQPGDIQVASAPFEAVVQRVLVTPGQPVAAGAILVTITPSPAAQTALQKAKEAYDSAQQTLAQVSEEYAARLAVKTQLLQAQQAAKTAELDLDRLRQEGVDRLRALRAPAAGVVSDIAVQEGKLATAGTPIVGLAVNDRMEVKLGVEPEDLTPLRAGQPVELTPVSAAPGPPIAGHIRLIAQKVDPATQLIDVQVALPAKSGLTLGAYVQGVLRSAPEVGLVVPRSAVLRDGDGFKLFTVADGRAEQHAVRRGVVTDEEVEVIGAGLFPGQQVVTTGAYELAPGMAVSTKGGP